MQKKLFWLFLFTFLLTACAGENPISDTSWKLVSYGEVDAQTLAVSNTEAIISFDAEGTLSGNVGCNQLSGTYKVSGDKLVIGPLMTTLMACIDDALMQQETTMMMLLSNSHTFEIEGGMLTILSEDGSISTVWEKVE